MATFHCDSAELGRVFDNAVLFIGKADRPGIMATELTVSADSAEAVSTDSYALLRETFAVSDGPAEPITFVLGKGDLVSVGKACKADKNGRTVLDVDGEAGTVRVRVGAQTFDLKVHPFDFPNWKNLWTEYGSPTETFAVGDWQLAKIGKLKTGNRTSTVKFYPDGPLKPIRFEVGDSIRGLMMPVRV